MTLVWFTRVLFKPSTKIFFFFIGNWNNFKFMIENDDILPIDFFYLKRVPVWLRHVTSIYIRQFYGYFVRFSFCSFDWFIKFIKLHNFWVIQPGLYHPIVNPTKSKNHRYCRSYKKWLFYSMNYKLYDYKQQNLACL